MMCHLPGHLKYVPPADDEGNEKAKCVFCRIADKVIFKYVDGKPMCEDCAMKLYDKKKQQPITVEKTPGRNDICPCGSGKKFKHCHLNSLNVQL